MLARYGLALALMFACSFLSAQDTIQDSLERTVPVPPNVRRILSVQPEITRIIVALGGGEKLVGVDYFIRRNDHLFPVAFPRILELPPVSVTPEDMNFETAMRLNPDVIFASPSEAKMVDDLGRKLDKPVIALASMGSLRKFEQEIGIVGRVLGLEARASELVSHFRSILKTVTENYTPVPADKRPRVYLSFWGLLTRTPVLYEPVTTAGGANCAENLLPVGLGAIGTNINIEQILKWDPDIILVHGNYPPRERSITVSSVLGDPRLSSLKAVRQKRVYYTFGYWYWWDPAQVLIETLYLARLFHPDPSNPFDLEKEGNDVYRLVYGVENGFTAVAKILNCHEWLQK